MLDRIIEEFNEILIDAEVDYPAGREAGHRISYDDEKLTSALQKILPPTDFVWINKPVTVIGEDFTYEAVCLCSFPKTNGKVRYIVEDRGRLFIQRESQLKWHDESQPQVNSPEFLAAQREIVRGLGPKPEDPVTLARPSPSGSGCPHCGYFHPPDGMCI